MTAPEKINFKNTLQKKCIEIIEERIALSHNSIENANLQPMLKKKAAQATNTKPDAP